MKTVKLDLAIDVRLKNACNWNLQAIRSYRRRFSEHERLVRCVLIFAILRMQHLEERHLVTKASGL